MCNYLVKLASIIQRLFATKNIYILTLRIIPQDEMKGNIRESISFYFHRYFEITFWIVALLLLAAMSPQNEHASLCPFNAMGLSFCPGCGLGHSISWLFHGDLKSSFNAHPMGWFAVVILIYRIITLIRNPFVPPINKYNTVVNLKNQELIQ